VGFARSGADQRQRRGDGVEGGFGELTAQEASALANVVGTVTKATELHEFGQRIAEA
jgi:hypothetical protein